MHIRFIFVFIFALAMSGCSKEPPGCASEESVSQLKQLIAKSLDARYSEVALKLMLIDSARPVAYNKDVKNFSCKANLVIGDEINIEVEYESQFDEKNTHKIYTSKPSTINIALINAALFRDVSLLSKFSEEIFNRTPRHILKAIDKHLSKYYIFDEERKCRLFEGVIYEDDGKNLFCLVVENVFITPSGKNIYVNLHGKSMGWTSRNYPGVVSMFYFYNSPQEVGLLAKSGNTSIGFYGEPLVNWSVIKVGPNEAYAWVNEWNDQQHGFSDSRTIILAPVDGEVIDLGGFISGKADHSGGNSKYETFGIDTNISFDESVVVNGFHSALVDVTRKIDDKPFPLGRYVLNYDQTNRRFLAATEYQKVFDDADEFISSDRCGIDCKEKRSQKQ